MSANQILVLYHGMLSILYLICMVAALRRRGFHDPVSRLLTVFLGFSILWEIFGLLGANRESILLLPLAFSWLPALSVVLLAFLYLQLSGAYLRREPLKWFTWLVGLVVLVLLLAVNFNLLGLPDPLFSLNGRMMDRTGLLKSLLWLSWTVCVLLAAGIILQAWRTTLRMSNRTRVTYWGLAFVLIAAGELLYLLQIEVLGGAIRMAGVVLLALITLAHRLPDIRLVLRRLTSGLIVGMLELALYTLGFVGLQYAFRGVSGYDPLFVGLGLALVLLVLLNPLLRLIERWVNQRFFGQVRDHNRILREYSQSISNILDLRLLATVTIGLINEAFEVQHGALFTVDTEVDEDNQRRYRLKGVQGMGGELTMPGILPGDSPIVKALGEERRPLTQAEIDMLPQFRRISGKERSWLNHQDMDVFVPIHAKDEWVGVFALGSKTSGASYFDEDLELLGTLADQSAVALQNARLVESLVRVNSEFRRAYTAMEEAHRKLERIDRTKSDFISIASHELRTPLTVLSGYSQMLGDDPTFSDNPYYAKIVSGIYDGTTRLHEIVDSMLDVAKIDTRALDLQAEPIHLPAMLKLVAQSFHKAFRERNLVLQYDGMDTLPAVQGDSEALRKVFYHLIINAIKYTPDGGQVTISGRPLPQGNEHFPDGGVEIIVSDTGIGIDSRFKELIFTKFYQTGELALHSSGKTKFKGGGPGLGLAIVRGIIQAHGGRVWADSPGYDEESHPGSHFHVILPLKLRRQPSPVV